MSQNIDQIYAANPASAMETTDLLYLGRSPYGITDDFGITWADMQASITAVSTITSGTWEGSTIGIPYGGTGVTSVTSTPTASAWAGWDANSNFSANNLLAGFATTVTAAGTTTLTVASAMTQEFTGSSTQTVTMPVVSTLALGTSYKIINNSSGNVTVNSSGANEIQVMEGNTTMLITSVSTTGTGAASWNKTYIDDTAGVISITGTANQIIASSSTGNVTLSAPQDIAITSSPMFDSLSLTNSLYVGNIQVNGNSITSTDTNGNTYIQPNGTGKTVITNTATPSSGFIGQLGVVSVSASGSETITSYTANSAQSSQFYLAKSHSTTPGSFSAIGSSEVIGQIFAFGDDGTQFSQAAAIRFYSNGAVSNGIVPGQIQFLTSTTGGAATQALAIDSSQQATFTNNIIQNGYLKGTTQIKDSSNNVLLNFATGGGTPFNYWQMSNTPTGSGPYLYSLGGDTNVGMNFLTKGNGQAILYSTNATPMLYINGTGYQRTNQFNFADTAGNFVYTFPTSSGTIQLVGGALGTPSSGNLANCTGLPASTGIANYSPPTVTVYTSGSGTYTTPAYATYLIVELVGAGGGGQGSGTSPGAATNGGSTTFGSLSAGGGVAGSSGGAGGSASGGNIISFAGGAGYTISNAVGSVYGGPGAGGPFGGNGAPGNNAPGNGGTGISPGCGGGGGGAGAAANAGFGGGAGAYIKHIYSSPSATYSYAVGSGGTGGTAGTSGADGGNGANGYIIIYAYYV